MGVTNKKTLSKTRRHIRDLDQIAEDLKNPVYLKAHKSLIPKTDLPGLGEYYCIECAKWFESSNSQITHLRGKNHKRRVKALKEVPYSQKEAEAAIGLCPENDAATFKPKPEEMEEVEMGIWFGSLLN